MAAIRHKQAQSWHTPATSLTQQQVGLNLNLASAGVSSQFGPSVLSLPVLLHQPPPRLAPQAQPGTRRSPEPLPHQLWGPRVPLAGDQRLPLVQHPHALVGAVIGQQRPAVVPTALLVHDLASLPLLRGLAGARRPREPRRAQRAQPAQRADPEPGTHSTRGPTGWDATWHLGGGRRAGGPVLRPSRSCPHPGVSEAAEIQTRWIRRGAKPEDSSEQLLLPRPPPPAAAASWAHCCQQETQWRLCHLHPGGHSDLRGQQAGKHFEGIFSST